MEQNKVGEIIVGFGTDQQRTIQVKNKIVCYFPNSRTVLVTKLENEEGYTIDVINDENTGRAKQSNIWLTNDSFIAVICALQLYVKAANIDLHASFESIIDGKLNCSIDGEGLSEF